MSEIGVKMTEDTPQIRHFPVSLEKASSWYPKLMTLWVCSTAGKTLTVDKISTEHQFKQSELSF